MSRASTLSRASERSEGVEGSGSSRRRPDPSTPPLRGFARDDTRTVRAGSRSICWALVGALVLPFTHAHAQSASPAALTTLVGVYTDSQAARGKDVYAGSCRSCHTPVSHTGVMFAKWWIHKPLSDLYTFVAKNMPKNDPGSLDPYDAADVVAYLLKMNHMPVGPGDMPPDVDSLKKFRIEVKRSSRPSHSTAKRKKP